MSELAKYELRIDMTESTAIALLQNTKNSVSAMKNLISNLQLMDTLELQIHIQYLTTIAFIQ